MNEDLVTFIRILWGKPTRRRPRKWCVWRCVDGIDRLNDGKERCVDLPIDAPGLVQSRQKTVCIRFGYEARTIDLDHLTSNTRNVDAETL